MAGLGEALTGVNQARQRAAARVPLAQALGQLFAAQRAGAAQPEGFARAGQPAQDVPLTSAERDLYARRLSQLAGAEGAIPDFGAIPQVQARGPSGVAPPTFERAPSPAPEDLFATFGEDLAGIRAQEALSRENLAAEAADRARRGLPPAGQAPTPARRPRDTAPVLPRLRVLGLNRIEPPRTVAEAARMEPQLRYLERLLAAGQQQRMQQELAAMREEARAAREGAKEKAVGERFETREQRLKREHGERLKQRGEIAGETARLTGVLRTETERHNRAMENLRRQALDLQRIASQRALTKQERDQVFQLDRAYQQRVANVARLRDTIMSGARAANEPLALKLQKEITNLGAVLDPLLKAVGAAEGKRRGVAAPKPGEETAAAPAPILEDDEAILSTFGIE